MGRIEFHCTVVAKAAITEVWSQPHSEKDWMLDLVDLVDLEALDISWSACIVSKADGTHPPVDIHRLD